MDKLNGDILLYTAEYLSRQRKRVRRHKIIRFLIVFAVLDVACVFIFLYANDWYVMLKRDSEAENEFNSQWESTAKQVNLTGDWAEDVLAIAESQLGYSESSDDDWSAAFASFCLNYAKVEDFPLETDCNRWVQNLQKKSYELYHEANKYTPVPGDLIFLDMNALSDTENTDDSADKILANHVGIVVEVTPATDVASERIKTIEGDSDDSVQYVVYDFTDERIVGYGELPEKAE